MSDPYDTPPGRWGLIFHGSGLHRPAHTRQEWAQIADAITTADVVRHDRRGVRGDDAWCAVAADAYRRLHDADAYQHLRERGEPRWHADRDLVEAWLGAPVVPPTHEPLTMLDAHGWQFGFDPATIPDPADLSLLVDLAQTAGVVGAAGHTVSLLRWVDDGVFRDDAFLVLLWPPDGPARGSSAVSRDALLTPAGSPTDRIVGVLAGVADVANTLMSATQPAQARTDRDDRNAPRGASPTGARGRPFRVIDGANAAGVGRPPPLRVVPSAPVEPRRPRT